MGASARPTRGIITSAEVSADAPHSCMPEDAMMQHRDLHEVAACPNVRGGHG